MIEAEHSYQPGNPYKGLHVLVQHHSGEIVELQVHTEATQQLKDDMHTTYEIARSRSAPRSDREAATAKMIDAWDHIPDPPGLDTLTTLGSVPLGVKAYPQMKSRKGRE